MNVSDSKPVVNFSLKLHKDLTFEIWCDGLMLIHSYVSSEILQLPKHMKSFCELKNVLNAIEESYRTIRSKVDESLLIDEVIDLLGNPRFANNSKITFISEQLSLSTAKPSQIRYSPSTLGHAVMWHKTSPALYRRIRQSEVVTLPTERHVRRITSAFDVDMKMGESTIAYPKAR